MGAGQWDRAADRADARSAYSLDVTDRPISFLSDFGRADEFVGVVHGVIATIAPAVRVIDLTHDIVPGDVLGGALSLVRSIQYVPSGVVLAVVDPGVGTARRAVAAETEWGHFVGPDNGLLSPAVALMGGATRTVSLENPDVMLPSQGATFHGRDVFAPAAAVLASGEATLDDLGPLGRSGRPHTVAPPAIGDTRQLGDRPSVVGGSIRQRTNQHRTRRSDKRRPPTRCRRRRAHRCGRAHRPLGTHLWGSGGRPRARARRLCRPDRRCRSRR